MSLSPSTVASASSRGGSSLFSLTPSIILYAIAIILYGLTGQGVSGISRYWEMYIVLVAVISLGSGWGQAYLGNRSYLWYLTRQVIHWGALIALLYMLNTQGIRMLMNDQQYSLMLVYLLAFASLLAAVHVDFKLIFFGTFMTYCAYLLSVPQNNPVLVEIGKQFNIADAATKPFTMTIGLAIAAWILTLVVRGWMRSSIASRRAG